MKNKLTKILCLLLVFSLSLGLIGCGGNSEDEKDAVKISFASAAGYDYLKTLNGKKVTINGYMATSSPVDGAFFFLMNLPY